MKILVIAGLDPAIQVLSQGKFLRQGKFL